MKKTKYMKISITERILKFRHSKSKEISYQHMREKTGGIDTQPTPKKY